MKLLFLVNDAEKGSEIDPQEAQQTLEIAEAESCAAFSSWLAAPQTPKNLLLNEGLSMLHQSDPTNC